MVREVCEGGGVTLDADRARASAEHVNIWALPQHLKFRSDTFQFGDQRAHIRVAATQGDTSNAASRANGLEEFQFR